jgi:hypothetical protein
LYDGDDREKSSQSRVNMSVCDERPHHTQTDNPLFVCCYKQSVSLAITPIIAKYMHHMLCLASIFHPIGGHCVDECTRQLYHFICPKISLYLRRFITRVDFSSMCFSCTCTLHQVRWLAGSLTAYTRDFRLIHIHLLGHTVCRQFQNITFFTKR